MVIYYDSKTGNVERFVNKLRALTNWQYIKISTETKVEKSGHLITFTTQIGKAPQTTLLFMERWHLYVLSVSSSGNMNWGTNFALAADIISAEYNIPIFLKFELSGLDCDVKDFIQKVTDYADKEVDIPK